MAGDYGSLPRNPGGRLVSADHGVYCESCGSFIELLDGSSVRVCPTCRVVTCQGCWDAAHGRCASCVSDALAAGVTLRPFRGLTAARAILEQLIRLRTDAEALAAATTDPTRRDDTDSDLDLLLLRACAGTLRADADLAAQTASPRSAVKLADVQRQQDEEVAAIERAVAEIRAQRDENVADVDEEVPDVDKEDVSPRPSSRAWVAAHRDRLARIGAGVAAILVLAVVVPQIPAFTGNPIGTDEPTPPESDRAGTLGGNPEGSSPAAPGSSEESAATLVTFDEWRMAAPIPPEWRIERGSSDQVRVAAYPTAVDRSLELIASTTGAGVTMCRALTVRATALGLDFFVASEGAGLQLALPTGDERPMQPAWFFSADGSAGPSSTTTVEVAAGAWHRFEAVMDPGAAMLAWRVVEAGRDSTDPAPVASGDVALAEPTGEVCLTLPDGVPDRSALIDNMTIGQNQ
jgi:hypothetical protein